MAFVSPSALFAQSNSDIDDERQKQLEEIGILPPDPVSIRAAAASEFAKPIDKQSIESLEEIAGNANKYANLVAKLSGEYEDYIRTNSRYDFVIQEVRKASVVSSYSDLDTEFKRIRNTAYMHMGRIALADDKPMTAFFYFNDAYRLSVFSCSDGVENCTRYEAEQQMKSILGIEGQSYVHWQK